MCPKVIVPSLKNTNKLFFASYHLMDKGSKLPTRLIGMSFLHIVNLDNLVEKKVAVGAQS